MSELHVNMGIDANLVNAPANVFVVFNGSFDAHDFMTPNNAAVQSWGIVVTANINEVLVEEHDLDSKYSACNALDVINTCTDEGAAIWHDARELITFLDDSLDLMCTGAWTEEDAIREIEGSIYTDVKVTFMRD